MNHFRLSTLALACLVALSAASGAQAQPAARQRLGITQIMRSPDLLAPPLRAPSAGASAAPSGQRSAEYIVALVNSEPITNSEVQTRMARVLSENDPNVAKMPRAELARLVLERLINERAQLQVAKEDGIQVDDVAVDQAEQTIARQNELSVPQLRERVKADGTSVAQFRNDLRIQLLLTRVREREVDQKVKVTDADVDAFIQEQRAGVQAGAPEINLAQILVAVPEGASDAEVGKLQQKAQDLARRARAGENFAKLASEASDAPERSDGGALGLRSVDRYPPLFVEATRSTPVDGIAGPVRSGAGFHILKVLARDKGAAADGLVTQTEVRHILLRTGPNLSTPQAIAKLAEFKRRIQSGTAKFSDLARDNSEDPVSAKAGGDLGWTRPGQFVPEFEEVIDRLSPGQISDPVVSRFGVHLIQVEARRQARLSQAEQRDAARVELREKKADEAFKAWAEEVRARAYVEYREPPAA